jgi:hypothetical protein
MQVFISCGLATLKMSAWSDNFCRKNLSRPRIAQRYILDASFKSYLGCAMTYREMLIYRHREESVAAPESRVLDYMGVRNLESVDAWYRRKMGLGVAASKPVPPLRIVAVPMRDWWSRAREQLGRLEQELSRFTVN